MPVVYAIPARPASQPTASIRRTQAWAGGMSASGTRVSVSFGLSHIDRPPLGDVAAALYTLVLLNPAMDFVFDCRCDARSFVFDTRVIRKTIAPLEIDCPEVSDWIRADLNEEIQLLLGGNIA